MLGLFLHVCSFICRSVILLEYVSILVYKKFSALKFTSYSLSLVVSVLGIKLLL